ncbi:hypothetical protein CTI12_AA393500 [Artemisia annua]|uniref:Reverse transcriptase domain, Reverse transcriptase zinc-binding domain protein n=1 Tax=Artemisia annua TaxID=35608 RepID=A0A2U1MDI6_ARTAN|nr:hypothetical protein CTI12_AA393500 [Artemisia annua]
MFHVLRFCGLINLEVRVLETLFLVLLYLCCYCYGFVVRFVPAVVVYDGALIRALVVVWVTQVVKPTNGGSSSSKPNDEAHTGKSLSPSKASNNDNLNVKGSDGGGSSYNSPLDSGNEPIQSVQDAQVTKTYIHDTIDPMSLKNSFDALSKEGDIFDADDVVAAVMEMNTSTLDKSNKQADATSHSNDQNKVDSSKNMGFTNKDKVGFTPPPILKSILKNAVRKTQVVNTGNVASNSALNEVRTEFIDEGKTQQDVTGVSTQTTSPKNTSPLRSSPDGVRLQKPKVNFYYRPVSKPTNGGSSSSKPTDEAHTGKSLSPSKASNNDNLNVKGSDGGGSSYNSPLDSGNEPIQPDIHRAGFSLESKVRDIIGVNGWTWPNQCFSKIIWDNLKILCKLDNVSCIWAEIVSGISIRTANNSLWSVIQRLVFGAAVNYIWQERNFRLFQKNFRSEETVFKIIVDIVRHELLSLKIKRSVESVKAAVIWKIPLMSINGEDNKNQNNGVKGVT